MDMQAGCHTTHTWCQMRSRQTAVMLLMSNLGDKGCKTIFSQGHVYQKQLGRTLSYAMTMA
eukprot:4444677-Amphidinium_carterae.1